jgi:hypothetical protein
MKTKTYFSVLEMKAFEPAEKIGLVACVNPDGPILKMRERNMNATMKFPCSATTPILASTPFTTWI